ncbi:PadR family transcriptional regulator [Paenibacillus caseinilyticus]|uniref:Transcription regulator PadR N-terminal domain-containing protein n=1 Tax=Paenibacillus mucilaginosus K02 TaxID=997761 RepID=I0BT30_9BACL|nr:PadR family transcriptional regulator [Paenibacillus mucilaginosus]AFH65527.1 hypothetical protein B2K_33325 [Paenibacillus mucilaginosus K02]
MNIPQFVTLGALEQLGEGSGYDILQVLEQKKVNRWIGIKPGSIYHAIRQLQKEQYIQETKQMKGGPFPPKTMYEPTEAGRRYFDSLQELAFEGLYPSFYGFKLALKFNMRRSPEEIRSFADLALLKINRILGDMEAHLHSVEGQKEQHAYDLLFIEHERLLFEAEKAWIRQITEHLPLTGTARRMEENA